jgi:hypothetical protein
MAQVINAIFNEDLEKFLSKKGELEKIEKGEIFCSICGVPINLNNINLIVPYEKSSLKYVCDSSECIEKYYELNK